jgi:hypothetical protein
MKRNIGICLGLCITASALGQNNQQVRKETTTVTTTTTTSTVVRPSADLLGLETFNFLDATTVPEGSVDLRISGRWIDSTWENDNWSVSTLNGDDEGDDDQIILTPEIVWGATDRLELALSVPFWVDGEPREGNYDTYVGGQWRISDLDENCPAWALAGIIRVPTGEGSNGIDAQLRLIVSNEYDSGIRSHLNFWATTVNTDNVENARHFQYGAVAGLDGPLNDSGSLRWVFDYMYESSHRYGDQGLDTPAGYIPGDENSGEQRNSAEAGIQWNINECHKLGFAVQGGLDHAENETPEWAASLTYAYTIGN